VVLVRRLGAVLLTAALLAATAACSEKSDSAGGGSVAYGARSCSSWASEMDSGEQLAAAKELLVNAKESDGKEGDQPPTTGVVKQFATDLGAKCDAKSSEELLAVVADELYAENAAYYSL
jgi:hypothetical protein